MSALRGVGRLLYALAAFLVVSLVASWVAGAVIGGAAGLGLVGYGQGSVATLGIGFIAGALAAGKVVA